MKYIYLTFFLIFISCKSEDEYIGTYKSIIPNKQLKKKFKTQQYIFNNELILKKDSTFFFKTCGIYANGKWSINNKNIILKSDSTRFRNDSINKISKPEGQRLEELLTLKKYNNIYVSKLKNGGTYNYMKKVSQ
ncbi:hypothetical protein [Aurantibacter aestuarii]|uniref:DUF306 domain-containing protein n=1 Tax=Aurantibacter aestuarii TaxID=1266046 RepID=A0A2T1NDA8_9FLAO|nr:hypothetical protein [Aurantibacter aestuarii]PSG90425.1 hypothetical protein C7H52_03845 [Aurantibacter aestuarii]